MQKPALCNEDNFHLELQAILKKCETTFEGLLNVSVHGCQATVGRDEIGQNYV